MKSLALVALTVALATTAASADLLDFEGLGLAPGAAIPNTYGDREGLDITYNTFDPNTGIPLGPAIFGSTGYGDLANVLLGSGGAGSEVLFLLSPGYQLSLTGFDLGGAGAANQTGITVHVVDLAAAINPVLNLNGTTVLGTDGVNPAHSHYNLNITTSSSLVFIHVSPASSVGLDNINFSVSALPEPSAATALLAAGTLLSLRRRR